MPRVRLPAPGSAFNLDFFLSSHLGDALCSTPLARQLAVERGLKVSVVRHCSTRAVFANNPHVVGFTAHRGPRLYDHMAGDGHMIQRLQRGFGVKVALDGPDELRPDVYLSVAERSWAGPCPWPSG